MGPLIMSISSKKEGFIFDMLFAGKYYTRLMSGRLHRTISLEELFTQTLPISESVSLTELPRFVEALGCDQSAQSVVTCELTLSPADSNRLKISGTIATELVTQQCQRCLEPMPQNVDLQVHWQLPDDMDAYIEGHGKNDLPPVRLLGWVEDELILSLPLFAKHDEQSCVKADYLIADDEKNTSEPDMTRPFAGLKDLLNR